MTPHQKNYLKILSESKKTNLKSQSQKLKDTFISQLKEKDLFDRFELEFRFHPTRKWRFDFSCPMEKIAIEIQGGMYGNPVKCHHCHATVMRKKKDGGWSMVREGGRHQNATALSSEYEKLNEAQRLGWRVFLFTGKQISDRTGIEYITQFVSPGPIVTKV